MKKKFILCLITFSSLCYGDILRDRIVDLRYRCMQEITMQTEIFSRVSSDNYKYIKLPRFRYDAFLRYQILKGKKEAYEEILKILEE